jgi:rubredoxin
LHLPVVISTKRPEFNEQHGSLEKSVSSFKPEPLGSTPMKKWQCIVCGLIYNEADGWPDDGIAPGTLWQDVPEDWLCPDCGVGKMDFEMIEIN